MNRKVARVKVMMATLVVCLLAVWMPIFAAAQTEISDDAIQLEPGENAVLLPPGTVTPSEPFVDPAYYGRVLKHLPCLGTCDAPTAAEPSRLVKALLWMLYPTEPPELTEADRLRIQVKRDNQRADKLP